MVNLHNFVLFLYIYTKQHFSFFINQKKKTKLQINSLPWANAADRADKAVQRNQTYLHLSSFYRYSHNQGTKIFYKLFSIKLYKIINFTVCTRIIIQQWNKQVEEQGSSVKGIWVWQEKEQEIIGWKIMNKAERFTCGELKVCVWLIHSTITAKKQFITI